MAKKLVFKKYLSLFLFFLISHKSFSLNLGDEEEKCGCYTACSTNFTLNTVQDVQKISACQRGCRFFLLGLHTTHGPYQTHDLKRAKKDCLLSCNVAYKNLEEMSSCQFGCTAVPLSRFTCDVIDTETSQTIYSIVIENTDIRIHPGGSKSYDILWNPSSENHIEKNVGSFLESSPKVTEIRFTSHPLKLDAVITSHENVKCPKQYSFGSRLEFQIGKIVIGDLYLFIGIFIFVIICYLLSHYFEKKNLKEHLQKMKTHKKNYDLMQEPLLQTDTKQNEPMFCQDIPCKPESFKAGEDQFDAKIGSITLVIQEEESLLPQKC